MGKLRVTSSKSCDEKQRMKGRRMMVKAAVIALHKLIVPKEPHFPVIAGDMDDADYTNKFMVPLSYLTQPSFLRLLEEAAEEYGFRRDGALVLPCTPSQLQKILTEECKRCSYY